MGDITGHRLSVNREMTGLFQDVQNALTHSCRDSVRKKPCGSSSVVTIMFL